MTHDNYFAIERSLSERVHDLPADSMERECLAAVHRAFVRWRRHEITRFSVTYQHGAESDMVAARLTFRRALWHLSGPFEACPEGITETAARHLPMADGTLTQRRTMVYPEGITPSSRARIARYLRAGLGSQAKPAPRPHGPVWDPYALMPRGTSAEGVQEHDDAEATPNNTPQRSPRSAPRKTRRSVSATIEAPTPPPAHSLPASGAGDLFG